ncbi:surf-like protein [Tilletia horrida]|uniref:SURF1-like protein n=1 Tax=Tilletia horrida TaxID=155126 RepID=A0AAN6GHK0_9BASI|nr:surf-like protein [Tilletia horrida]KAK0565308.1 surf-like protein [Tilletia horrida]
MASVATTTTTTTTTAAAGALLRRAALPPRAAPRLAAAVSARAYHGDLSSSEYHGQGARKSDSPADRPWYTSPTTLVLGFIPLFTAGLGFWQLQRLKWKVSLIEELEDKLRKDPIVLPKNINLDALSAFEFRLVQLDGSFDPDPSRILFLGPRVKDGILGYQVVVPFRRANGGADVLVNRGFVAKTQTVGEGKDRRLRNHRDAFPAKAGETKVLALLPRIYPANAFTPPNEPQNNSWFHADPKEMAAHLSPPPSNPGASTGATEDDTDHYTPSAGVAASVSSLLGLSSSSPTPVQEQTRPVLPILLEEIFEGHAGEASQRVLQGIPLGRAPTIELRNQHAVYAGTWFSLSAATAAMFAILVRRGRGR